jgi:hypothetical protein
VHSHGAGQTVVGGEKHGVETLRQGHIGGVVSGEVPSQKQDPLQQELMPVPDKRQVAKVLDSFSRADAIQLASEKTAPQDRRNLDIAERRNVEINVPAREGGLENAPARRPQKVLDERRGVDDDYSTSAEASTTIRVIALGALFEAAPRRSCPARRISCRRCARRPLLRVASRLRARESLRCSP